MSKLTPEGRVKKAGRKLLQDAGAVTYMPTTGGMGRSGFFDEFACLKGVPIGIEYKATDKDMPTILQTDNAFRWNAQGTIALCIHKDNLHVLEQVLHSIALHGMQAGRIMQWPEKALAAYFAETDKEFNKDKA